MYSIRSFILIVAALVLSMSGQGFAAVTQYDLTSFSNATSSNTMLTEDFELVEVTLNQNSPGANLLHFSAFDVSSSLMSLKVLDDPFIPGFIPNNTGSYNTTVGGQNFLVSDTNQPYISDYMLLSFNQPIFAFGLNLIDIEDGGTVNINNSFASFDVSPTLNGEHFFFGVVSDTPITNVKLNLGTTDSNWSIDDVTYTTAPVVPEPISSVLFLVGGSVLAGRRFMRKRR